MSKFKKCIGLEVHAQIDTKTKLFSRALVDNEAEPNTQVDWLDAGMPGALPVPNKAAIEMALKSSLALNMDINQTSVFDRKHYFYQDLPLGYQITQFYKPIGVNGYLNCSFGKIRINRLHIETDAGKSIYKNGETLIDLNRAGVPLMEIVTEPDFSSEEEVIEFLKELKLILIAIGTCKCDMEKGNLRADVNISLNKEGQPLGTRVEIKNLNSFVSIKKAIEFEYNQQQETLNNNEKVMQETKLFDTTQEITQSIRDKDDFWGYCYFPDPDLLPIVISDDQMNEVKLQIPELPQVARERFQKLGIAKEQSYTISENLKRIDFFDKLLSLLPEEMAIKASNWFCSEFIGQLDGALDQFLNNRFEFYKDLAKIISMCEQKEMTRINAKELLEILLEKEASIEKIIEEKGFLQKEEIDIDDLIDNLFKKSPYEVERYKAGKTQLLMYFVGCLMKETQGKVNPDTAKEKLEKKLNKEN